MATSLTYAFKQQKFTGELTKDKQERCSRTHLYAPQKDNTVLRSYFFAFRNKTKITLKEKKTSIP